jgi:uncharacterized protein (TIGR03545 family)
MEMNKWVRWWGLIAFAAVVGSFALFWVVFADSLVRRAVEKAGTSLVGAEVNVGGADVSFFPLGIALTSIEVTDPETPANNRVQIGRTAFSLDGLLLFRRKVIISEMSVEGVRFNVPRKRPGRVAVPPEKKDRPDAEPSFSLPRLDLPSAKKVLESEDLSSLSIIDEARSDVRKARDEWSTRLDGLSDKTKLDSYRDRLKTIQRASRGGLKDIAKSTSDLRDLKRDLDQDILQVREAKRSFSSDYARSKEIVDQAVRAPLEDVRRIKEKYGLSTAGLQNMSRALFGRKISSWVDTGLLWYGRLKPLMARDKKDTKTGTASAVKPARAKGLDVRFREHSPRPDLLVSLVKASFQPEAGVFDGTIRNITPDQDILGSPLTFAFSGSGLRDAERVSLDGTFDHVRPARPEDVMRLRVEGYRTSGLALSSSSDLPVTLQQGQADLDLSGRSDGTSLSATVTATIRGARIEAGGGGGAILSAVRSSLARVSQFTVTADIAGTPDDYSMKVSSDLDKVLKDAVSSVIGEKAAAFEKDLQTAIQERTGGALKGLQGDLGGLGSLGGAIDSTEGQLSSLLKDASQGAGGKLKLPF